MCPVNYEPVQWLQCDVISVQDRKRFGEETICFPPAPHFLTAIVLTINVDDLFVQVVNAPWQARFSFKSSFRVTPLTALKLQSVP